MIISRVMTRDPVFGNPEMSVNEVRDLMEEKKIGHIPVLDKENKLVGIITKEDLFKSGPSAATSLDMYEISYLLSKMTAKDVMQKNVITVGENEVVEEAARIMADHSIGCLPVMREKLLIGIITDTDLFHVFVNSFGARSKGVRITFSIQEKQGQLAKLTQTITEKNGNIHSLITSDGDDPSSRRLTTKIEGLSLKQLETIMQSFPDVSLEDIREIT